VLASDLPRVHPAAVASGAITLFEFSLEGFMPNVRNASVRDGDVLVLVGTMKGAFILRSNGARQKWDVGGPYFPGMPVYAMAFDGRGKRRRLWAAPGSEHWGTSLAHSDDFGKNWTQPDKNAIRFPDETGATVTRIWQIRPGRDGDPNTLYAGAEPAALFESHDAGETWSLNEGLWGHEHRSQWQPGFGGLGLHTIIPDGTRDERMWIAISTGGVYRTDDGGRTWKVRNKGVRAEYLPDKHPEFGQCVHKIAQAPGMPERLYLQNHWGLYRTDNGGDSWQDIANGVPSDFGFPVVTHPHDPETAYIIPLESDMFRCTPEGRLRVYRTRNGGESWEALTNGLPQKNALETVLRDAMDADPLNPAGVYFGTRSGAVYGSADGGTSWNVALDGLPPVVCVKAYAVGDPAKVRVPAKTAAKKPAAKKRAAAKKSPKKKAAKKPARKEARKAAPRKKSAAKRRPPKKK
jgi:photosystem II stability/assembly factor-like uncharacterized protein